MVKRSMPIGRNSGCGAALRSAFAMSSLPADNTFGMHSVGEWIATLDVTPQHMVRVIADGTCNFPSRSTIGLPPRDSFTASTKRAIANRVGHFCSHPDCGVPTKGPATNPARTINVGDAAHITAASPGGPRYDSRLTRDQRTSPENGIWLCKTHAKLVDDDEEEYTVEKLRLWKGQRRTSGERET